MLRVTLAILMWNNRNTTYAACREGFPAKHVSGRRGALAISPPFWICFAWKNCFVFFNIYVFNNI